MTMLQTEVVPQSRIGGGCVLRIKQWDGEYLDVELTHDAAVALRAGLEVVTKSFSGHGIAPALTSARYRAKAE